MCQLQSPARPSPAGSRRRRLWELGGHAHCPVIGVCLPLAVLRRLVDKAMGNQTLAGDYELHCGAIADCKHRSPIAEAVQRELDRRNALVLRQSANAKTTETLQAWWREASRGNDLGGALWATLTHARCTSELEHQVLGEVHMVQHQVGMARRADLQQFETLVHEHAVLTRELGAAQQRSARMVSEHARRCELQQTQIVQLRAQLIGRDTALAALHEDMQALQAAAPGLKSRFELTRESERQVDRIHALQRSLLQAQQDAEQQRRRADELAAEHHHLETALTEALPHAAPDLPSPLSDQAVLCVGGRAAIVPVYRQLIERTGGRFLHHDGGEEDSNAKLDATLAAADLVICQTGCISHDAYWRVKDHCKRTGKRCVFVESPSGTGLKRALLMLSATATTPNPPG